MALKQNKQIAIFQPSPTQQANPDDVGASLLKFAKEAEFTAQRGAMDELFPYVYQAAKRMSTRAICKWLLEAHKIKLSVVTVAKALREEDRYWLELYERIRPAAREFAVAHNVEADFRTLLLDKNKFENLKDEPYVPFVSGAEEAFLKHMEYKGCVELLEEKWFVLDAETRATCLKHAHRLLIDELKPKRGKKG